MADGIAAPAGAGAGHDGGGERPQLQPGRWDRAAAPGAPTVGAGIDSGERGADVLEGALEALAAGEQHGVQAVLGDRGHHLGAGLEALGLAPGEGRADVRLGDIDSGRKNGRHNVLLGMWNSAPTR
jgi:hypothetical protein